MESYNNNIDSGHLWKRSFFILLNLVIILMIVFLIYFSFSQIYAKNMYLFLFVLKVLKMLLEKYMDYIIEDML